MAKVIHKETIEITGNQQIFEVPRNSKIVKFALQDEVPRIWIEKPEGAEADTEITVQVFGTGIAEIPDVNAQFIDTVIMGAFVWHLYQLLDL